MKIFLPLMVVAALLILQRHYANHCDAMLAAARYACTGDENDNTKYRRLFWRSWWWFVAFFIEVAATIAVYYRLG